MECCEHGDIGPHWCEDPPEVVPQAFVDAVARIADAFEQLSPDFLSRVRKVDSLDELLKR